jgi:hypothetical protein
MLKFSTEKITIPLQIIFNTSLRQCRYPSSWQNAHVIAIFKKGDTSLPSNYPPISLISWIVLYSSINWWTEECLGKKPDWHW